MSPPSRIGWSVLLLLGLPIVAAAQEPAHEEGAAAILERAGRLGRLELEGRLACGPGQRYHGGRGLAETDPLDQGQPVGVPPDALAGELAATGMERVWQLQRLAAVRAAPFRRVVEDAAAPGTGQVEPADGVLLHPHVRGPSSISVASAAR